MKKNFENAIEIYKSGVSLEADKQISYLEEKLKLVKIKFLNQKLKVKIKVKVKPNK